MNLEASDLGPITILEPDDIVIIEELPEVEIDLSFILTKNDPWAVEEEVIKLTNDARRKSDLAQLTRNAHLDQSALVHTLEMVEHGFISHTGQFGSTLKERVGQAGYMNFRAIGENLARGQQTASEVVQGWLNSPGHRANLLNPIFREIGVAYVLGKIAAPNGQVWQGGYWTQNFGARYGSSVHLTSSRRGSELALATNLESSILDQIEIDSVDE